MLIETKPLLTDGNAANTQKRMKIDVQLSREGDLLDLCKKLKFHNTDKCYLNKPEPLLANETPNIFWEFDVQTDHTVLAKRPDLIVVNKKNTNLSSSVFCSASRKQ